MTLPKEWEVRYWVQVCLGGILKWLIPTWKKCMGLWVYQKRRRRLKQKPERIRMLICSSICPIIQTFSTFLNDQNFKSQIMLICYSQMNLIPILNHLWNIQQYISGVNEPITKRPPWIIIIWVKNRLWS